MNRKKRAGRGLPRVMIAAPSSGSGKTLITCGILQAFVNRGMKAASFKCGPDYIDPMFHSKIIGAESKNLDTFFTDENTTKYLFAKTAQEADISVMEGVMGFYDGLEMDSFAASSYELSRITKTPVILVVNCRGMSRSAVPAIAGFVNYAGGGAIKGVVLNQAAESIYPELKAQIEAEIPVRVLGYVPYVKDLIIESRHLGLVSPDEVEDYREKLDRLAVLLEKTLDMAGIIALAEDTEDIDFTVPVLPQAAEGGNGPLIAVARDEAFCFYYRDNIEILREMGASIIEFSPLRDSMLPQETDGLILGGGYPELFAEELTRNVSMRDSIKSAVAGGLPCMAECGGFMYLHETMEDMAGKAFPMAGAIEGAAYRTGSLKRFGYIELKSDEDQMLLPEGGKILGHEFHYFDSTSTGESCTAAKPGKDVSWKCIHGGSCLSAGYPHLYYYSNTEVPYRFLKKCMEMRIDRNEGEKKAGR